MKVTQQHLDEFVKRWQAPAKHARGNIFDESKGLGAIDKHGFIKYLR